MLRQEEMIARLREVCQRDRRLVAAMLYGSFTQGEGDEFSDIECLLYFDDASLAEVDPRRWIAQIAPVALYYVNEHGIGTAIFEDLIRGEFHFERAEEIGRTEGWRGNVWFPSLASTLLLDRTGELSRCLRPFVGPPPDREATDNVQFLMNSLINWTVFGQSVLARGELARAMEILGMVHRYLLWMARLIEGKTTHWPTPSRKLEQDLSAGVYERFAGCTASLDRGRLHSAYQAAWLWAEEMMAVLSERYGASLPETLCERVEKQLLADTGLRMG